MKTINVEQGTAEWREARRAKISGTRLKDIMGTDKKRAQLWATLLAEEGTEQVKVTRATEEMERGIVEENFGIKLFEEQTGKKVDKIGLCVHKDEDWLVLSPDGLIKDKNGKYSEAVEVKSPNSSTVMYYQLLEKVDRKELGITPREAHFMGGIPADYKWQVVHYFIVNDELQKLHFLVYDARFIDDKLKLHIYTVEREDKKMLEAIGEAKAALDEFRKRWLKYRDIILPSNF